MLRRFGSLLRLRDFRSLVLVTTLSQLGDRLTHMLLISIIALASPGRLLAYSQGALVFALPTLLLSPFAGVLVDRWDKRRVLAVTHFSQSALLLVTPLLILLTGSFVPFWIALALFFGLDLFNNTAHPALLPALVEDDRILAANSVNLTFARLATVVGMVAGGFLIRWVGWGFGLAIDASTHLAAGLLALTIATRMLATSGTDAVSVELARSVGRFFRDLADVLRLVGRNRLVGFVMGSVLVSTFVSAVAYTVLIYVVQQVLGLGTPGVGVLSGVLAVGMIGGAAGMSLVRQDINRPLVVAAAVLLYGLLFLIGRWHVSALFVGIVALLAGVSFSSLGIVQNTILQEEVPADIRGRIFSTREFVVNLTFILSTLLIGAVGDLTSYRVVLPVVGALLVVLGLLGLLFVRSIRTERALKS